MDKQEMQDRPAKAIALLMRVKLKSGYKSWGFPELQFVDEDFSDQDFLSWIKARVLSNFPEELNPDPALDVLTTDSVIFTASMRANGSDSVRLISGTIYSRQDCLLDSHWKPSEISEKTEHPMPPC